MSEENKRYEAYVAAYDAAQRLHARLAAERIERGQLEDLYAAKGRALHQIKELARAGFLLLPKASEEGFEQLWREAFDVDEEKKDGQK